MKKMLCYFAACVLILACIAGCVTPGTTEPSAQLSTNITTTGTETTTVFTVPTYELDPLPTVDRETVGPPVEYDPDRELYILTGQNDIIYEHANANSSYGFRIYSKKPLDVSTISVKLPISGYYSASVRQVELKGTQEVGESVRMDERYYSDNTFTFPMYLAYQGADFRKLAELEDQIDQLRVHTADYGNMLRAEEITFEQYELLMEPLTKVEEEYNAYINTQWEKYMALTAEDIPQFYVYSVIIRFRDLNNLGAKLEQEESFTQIEVTIGDQTYVQDVGRITLIDEWELPAQTDWEAGFTSIAGILGNTNGPAPYNDGIHCINTYYHYVADRYELLEELVMLNPAQKVERVWLQVRPKGGDTLVVEWDMSEPYEIYPGDDVTVYAIYRDENLDTLRYETMTDAYLLCTSDGESYCRVSQCATTSEGSPYLWYAILFDGVDFESYYWDYYYRYNEPWRYDPEEDPILYH